MPAAEPLASNVRGSIELAPHVHDAIERAHQTTQDCLRYLHTEEPATAAARRAKAKVALDQKAALQAVAALEGRTLRRTTSTGKEHSITITRRHLGPIRACLDAVYGLARKWCAVNERVEPIVPLTRPLGAEMASKLFSTSKRTWTKWLPWLHAAGVLVYQHGTQNHPSLVGIPSLYKAHVAECRDVVKGRFADGYTTYVDDAEVARRGRWWEPICATLLDEVSDVHERLARFTDHLLSWCERARGAAARKQAAILEKLSKRYGDGALLAAARALERAKAVKGALMVEHRASPPKTDQERSARRSLINDHDRSIMFAQKRVDAAEQEAGVLSVDRVVDMGIKALIGSVTTPTKSAVRRDLRSMGGGTRSNRNDLSDYYVVSEGKAAQASPAKPNVRPSAVIDETTQQNKRSGPPPPPEAGQEGVRGIPESTSAATAHETLTGLAKTAREAVEAASDPAATLFALFGRKKVIPLPAGAS